MSTLADADLSSLGLDNLLSLAGEETIAVEPLAAAAGRPRVAIIGLAGRIAGCEDLAAFWELLRDGRTTRRRLPPAREADLSDYLRLKGVHSGSRPLHLFRESFLSEVDKFDHRFFGLAKQEANLMDPNQRLFLETAWAALEHAGYGGEGVKGSATGVFVGFSADFGADYRDIVRTHAPDAPEVSVVGNVKSIIASRLAYHLDLRGPSLMVDTACSSGLVALHLACRSLLAGECEMAVAGAVKVDLVPVADDPELGIGIKDIQATMAHDGRTRTFDDSSEGTSGAEGVLAFVLKPLERALADGDTIHAVVAGSAINQDGLSVGITAPNMAAQEALILHALEEAEIDPQTISCFEAHGTATKLGDPIEVSAIGRAYGRYSQRRQYCAIGSVKSNVGHLDNAAGLAGVAKMVLAMQHRQIPASLHFARPNRKIAFESGPVYVNDVLRPWSVAAGAPRRAGINSFGLSGTNCHVILEEPPAPAARGADFGGPHLLLLSAMSDHSLERLIASWQRHLKQFTGRAEDLCFTAAVGRLHHHHRLAIRFHGLEELRELLAALQGQGMAQLPAAVVSGSFRRVDERRAQEGEAGLLGDGAKKQLDRAARDLTERALRSGAVAERGPLLDEAAALYVRGADFEWERWYGSLACHRIPLPSYPFARIRCWVSTTGAGERLAQRASAKQFRHPLLDRCAVASRGLRIYEADLGVQSHWELAEHQVQGSYILPGTGFIEMVLEVAAQLHGGALPPLTIEQLLFLQPLALATEERRNVQLQVSEGEGGRRQLQVVSQAPSGEWEIHAEAQLRFTTEPATARAVAELRAALPEGMGYSHSEDEQRGLVIGDRWNLSVQQAWTNAARDTLLVQLALAEPYRGEEARYHCHPALLDTAVNAANHLAGEGELYLPFSYKRLEIFRPLPAEFYAYLRRKPGHSAEAFHLDIELLSADGSLCARASDYTVKRVAAGALGREPVGSLWHALRLVPAADPLPPAGPLAGPLLLVREADAELAELAAQWRAAGVELLELVRPAEGYDTALAALAGRRLGGIIYALGWSASEPAPGLIDHPSALLHDLTELVQGCGQQRLRADAALLLTRGGFVVENHGAAGVRPHIAALAALARIVRLENPQLPWRCVDADQLPAAPQLLAELAAAASGDLAVWRAGQRYRERLEGLPAPTPRSFTPHPEGIYLITGGSGALGLELAALLAARGPVKLALIASTPLPPRDEWEDLALDPATPERLRRRLSRLLAISEAGAQLECVAVDVGDPLQLERVIDTLRTRFGRINGVIHAAGRAGAGFLHSKSAATFDQVVAPKMAGALALHRLTRGDPLDFFIMYSSVATVLRAPGQSDYTAGNAYLDALAHHRRQLGLPALAVCWPAWREVGIAVEYGAVDEQEIFTPIATATALPLMEQLLADDSELPPVVVASELNPRASAESLTALGIELPEALRSRLRRSGERPAGAVGSEATVLLQGLEPEDEIARQVATLWGRILGVTELAADDAFGDLGGNSILTTQLYREYEQLYPGRLDVVDLFTYTTVREQVEFLRTALGVTPAAAQPAAADDLDAILARLADGSISAEEAASFLSH